LLLVETRGGVDKGKFVEGLSTPGAYKVRFMIALVPQHVDVTVAVGVRSNVDRC